ncbi:MAG: MFS transporter [Burkholderiaceae bacterium]
MRLIAGQVCVHATMAGMRLAAPLWALKEGHSAAAVGVLLALFALMQVFLALPAGRYADAHGLRKPVGFAVMLASAGALLATAVPHFAVLCIAALCTGGATGVVSVALQRHVGRAAENPTQLKQVFSWLAIGPAASNFLGPFTAGLLIDHAGFRAAFFLMALLPIATWFWVRGTQELPPVEVNHEVPKKTWDLMREPMFRRLLLVNWLLSSCWDVHTFVVPILGHERGYSASVIGTILGAFAIAAAAVRVLLPMLAHSLREWAVVTVSMVLTALLFAVYPLMPTALSMGVCSVVLGFTLGCVQPMIMSTLHQITPEDRHGEAIGLRLMAINASSVLMPMLFGVAGAVVGVAGLFWVVGGAVGAGGWLAAKLKLD